jgi:hypothetical protein
VKTIWTQDFKDLQSKQDYEVALRANPYISKLRDILEARDRELCSQLISIPEGEAWQFKQIHLQGRLFDLRETLELLTFNRPNKGTK